MANANTLTLDPPTRSERFFGIVAYLCWYSPLCYVAPLVLYFWKGNKSRFIGFHAVQSTLLVHACLLTMCATTIVSAMAFGVSGTPSPVTSLTLAGILSIVVLLAMAVAMFLGRRAVLPLLGRWTERIIAPLEDQVSTDTSPAAIVVPRSPDERIHAGIAYLSTFSPFMWIWYPLALYVWKGRRERFIGFHAIQSLLLVVTMIPVACGSMLLSFLLVAWLTPRFPALERYMGAVAFGTYIGVFLFPVFMIIGMGIYVMRGGRGVLPLLGRLAKLIIGKRLAEQGVGDEGGRR